MSSTNNRHPSGLFCLQIKLKTKDSLDTVLLCETPQNPGSDNVFTDTEFLPPCPRGLAL